MALEATKGLSAQIHSTEKSHRFGKSSMYCLPYLKRSLWSRLRTGEQGWRGERAHTVIIGY